MTHHYQITVINEGKPRYTGCQKSQKKQQFIYMASLLVGVLLLITSYGLYLYGIAQGASLAEAQTVAATVFVVLESAYLLNCRSFTKPMWEVGYFPNMWVYYGILAMFFVQALISIHRL